MSIDIGAVRLTEKFGEEIDIMQNYIDDKIFCISDIIEKYEIKIIAGIGGSITTASSINQAMVSYDTDKIHNSELSINDIESIQNMLAELSVDERKKVVGLQAERADIILAGITILKEIMKVLDFKKMKVSEYDNLEGMICYYLKDI